MSSTTARPDPSWRARDRYVIGSFRDVAPLRRVVEALADVRIDAERLALMAAQGTLERKLGWRFVPAPDAAARGGILAAPAGHARLLPVSLRRFDALAATDELGPVLLSRGTLSARLRGTGLGAGEEFGDLLAPHLGAHSAAGLADRLAAGSILLWAATGDAVATSRACDVMLRHSDGQVHVHDLAARGPADDA